MKLGFLFVPIAEREVHFYLAIAQELKRRNPDTLVLFSSLFQPTDELIRAKGYEVLSIYDQVGRDQTNHHYTPIENSEIRKVEKEFGISNLHKLILHEKLTFGIQDHSRLYAKFCHYLRACDAQILEIKKRFPDYKWSIVQELGGFIGPLSFYFAAQKNQVDNFFTEPAFYKGRIHFNRNSLDSCVQFGSSALVGENRTEGGASKKLQNAPQTNMNNSDASQSRLDVRKYLKDATEAKTIVAAVKDRHHYLDMGLKKIFNIGNFTKFFRKIWFKIFKGYRQEYEHIYNHTLRSLKMLVARKLNSRLYFCDKNKLQQETYFYFPFHVQLDYALTVRSPEYLDQLGLVEKILQVLPVGAKLVVKEHPASIGGLDRYRLNRLLKNENCLLLHPSFNSYDVIKNSKGVITINSKVGAEALVCGKSVFAFGKCFYSDSGLVKKFSGWPDLEGFLNSALDGGLSKVDSGQLEEFFLQVWTQSYPNELYVLDAANVENFSEGLLLEASR